MSLTNLFAKIASRHQERQLARKADFKSLVKAVAEEQEPDPEEVERILAESNKTLEDLSGRRVVPEAESAEGHGRSEAQAGERPRADQQTISQASEALTAAETKYKEVTDPLLGQRDYIRDQLLEIDRAKTELERTCDDQDLLNELAKTERQLNVLHTRRNETEFALTERKRRMTELKEAAYRLEHPQEVSNRDESAIRLQSPICVNEQRTMRGNHRPGADAFECAERPDRDGKSGGWLRDRLQVP